MRPRRLRSDPGHWRVINRPGTRAGRLHSPGSPSCGREGSGQAGRKPRKRETMAKTKQKKADKKKADKKADKKKADTKTAKKAGKKAEKKNAKKAVRSTVIEKAEQSAAALKTVSRLPDEPVAAMGQQGAAVVRRTRVGATTARNAASTSRT